MQQPSSFARPDSRGRLSHIFYSLFLPFLPQGFLP